VLVLAWPLLGLVMLALAALAMCWRRRSEPDDEEMPEIRHAGQRWMLLGLTAPVGVMTVVLPVGALIGRLPSLGTMGQALHTYPTELWTSLAIAAAAGVAAVWMGVSAIAVRRVRPVVVGAVLVFGVLPAALVGHAVLAAYLPVGFVYNSWLLLAIGYVARYGWIGVLVAWLAWRSAGSDVVAQARTDGAGEIDITLGLRYRPNIALLLCGVAVVAAMSLADVALGSLLTVPGIGPISGKLMEKFHRFEYGMLVSLSLWLVAAALPPVVLAWIALRLRRGAVTG
jgi:ABC-type Fe3+ transport system permease subunit